MYDGNDVSRKADRQRKTWTHVQVSAKTAFTCDRWGHLCPRGRWDNEVGVKTGFNEITAELNATENEQACKEETDR
jgi:hypothetical protein